MDNFNAHVFYLDEGSYSFKPLKLVTRSKPNAIVAINSIDEGAKVSILAVSEGTTDHSSDSSWISIYQYATWGFNHLHLPYKVFAVF